MTESSISIRPQRAQGSLQPVLRHIQFDEMMKAANYTFMIISFVSIDRPGLKVRRDRARPCAEPNELTGHSPPVTVL